MHILHLVDLSDHSSTAPLACAAAVRRLPARHTLWTIGHAPSPLSSLTSAPQVSRSLGAPLRKPLLAWRSLQRELARHAADVDLITCWSPATLAAAALAKPRAPVIGVFTSPCRLPLNAIEARFHRAALDRFPILCFSDAAAADWRRAGAPDVRIASPRLAFHLDGIPSRDDARAALNIAPDERVIALFADPPAFGDARRFAYLAGLLSVGGAPTVALVHARNTQVRRAARFIQGCGRLWRLLVVDSPLVHALPACDAAIIDTRVVPNHPLLYPAPGHSPEPVADTLAASLAAQLRVPLIVPPLAIADDLRAADIPFVRASDTSCLSFASSVFHLYESSTDTPSPARTSPDALDTLFEIWQERLNTPRPGFPLRHGAPVPSIVLPPVA